MRSTALLAILGMGCSFVRVRGPSQRVDRLPTDRAALKCTESSIAPSLDAFAGVAAVSATTGGLILEHTSEDGEPEHFTKYYAGPLVAIAILSFISASYGNNRITWCSDANERLRDPGQHVIPVNPDRDKPAQEIDLESPNP